MALSMKNYQSSQSVPVWKEHFLGLAIVVAFLLPHTSILFLLVNPLLCLLLLLSSGRRWLNIVFIPLVPIFIATVLNLEVAQMKAIQSTAAIMLYFACFPFVSSMRMRNGYLYFIFGVIFLSQIVYLLGLPYIGQLIDRIYPLSEENVATIKYGRSHATFANVFDYRYGGLYHNANQCSKYLTMLLAFFLINNRDERMSKITPFVVFAYLSVLLGGSRTGFVVATIIIYFAFFRKRKLSNNYKLIIGTLALIGFIYFMQRAVGTVRGLDIERGMSGSVNVKWETFMFHLITEKSILGLLFGHLDTGLFEGRYGLTMNHFDTEYGNLVFCFGLIGFFSVFVFWYMVYKRLDSYNRIFLVNLLWVITSTIVCSYRTFFVFMLLLSVLYSNNSIVHKKEKNHLA